MKIDVIIPVYKPGQELFELLGMLAKQTVPVQNIIIMNTEEKYFQQLVYGRRFLQEYKNVRVFHLSKKEFDHGGTRRRGVRKSDADIFVMMTQDALPADERLIEELTAALKDKTAVSYARQLPAPNCRETEKIARLFNYPPKSRIKTAEDIQELGIKTYFCSNVCAAYRRDIYEELGGFPGHTIFNEDMIYAAGAIRAGYAVAYEAKARVIHSHNDTCIELFRRSFDLGVSQAQYRQVFQGISSESEGKKLILETSRILWRDHVPWKLPGFYIQCFCRYAGYLLGRRYEKLPRKWVLAFTANKEYWER